MSQPCIRMFTVTLVAAWTVAGCSSPATETASTDGADASDVGTVSDVSGADAAGDATATTDGANVPDVADTSDIADTSGATDAASVDVSADAADAPDVGTPICYSNDDCAPTEYCKIVPPACAGVCAPLHKPGEECGIDGILCVPGAVCTNGATCHVPVEAKLNESCHYDFCGLGLYCDGYQSGKTCYAKADVGGPCQYDPACLGGLMCDPSHACAVPYPDGASCFTVASTAQCKPGSICAQVVDLAGATTQTCLATKSSGAACTSHTQCTGGGQHCKGLTQTSGSSGVCASLPAVGSTCLDAAATWGVVPVCLAPGFCLNNVCTAPGTSGSACDGNTPCAAGLKCASKGGSSKCLTPAQICQ